jgi:hypothetical protein
MTDEVTMAFFDVPTGEFDQPLCEKFDHGSAGRAQRYRAAPLKQRWRSRPT